MCVTCGCSESAEATILDLQTGQQTTLAGGGAQEHVHTHADGTTHSHARDPAGGHSHLLDHADHAHPRVHTGTAYDRNDEHGGAAELNDHDQTAAHEHVHADGTRHTHAHDAPVATIELEARILAKNDALADRNRDWFRAREILALNLVSSPGSGKTTLLERTIRDLRDEISISVIEGDQATANDGERIRAAGAAAVQVNTGTGCHLEADMIARGLEVLRPGAGSILMIENVGNLVCPALFDLGERAKVVILSVTEGEDKPLKYPQMFRAAKVMILNKIDLLPYLDFDVAQTLANARKVNPEIIVLPLSARSGEGLPAWYDWLRRGFVTARIAAVRQAAQSRSGLFRADPG